MHWEYFLFLFTQYIGCRFNPTNTTASTTITLCKYMHYINICIVMFRYKCKSSGNMASVTVIGLCCVLLLFLGVSGVEVECPPWFTLEHSNSATFPQCVCSEAMDTEITCKQKQYTSYLKIGHCAFQDVENKSLLPQH